MATNKQYSKAFHFITYILMHFAGFFMTMLLPDGSSHQLDIYSDQRSFTENHIGFKGTSMVWCPVSNDPFHLFIYVYLIMTGRQRMRALTMKKLKRLLAAEDRVESIAAVARLSLTDWLLFDMVLVHEQVDVIGRDKISLTNVEYKPMMELFALVQRYSIEGAHGDNLAERWAAATVAYNTQGRHCSPMLLQRRWYQIKELARYNFYKLWFSYRGNHKLWDNAQQFKPSRLQMAIAKRYPHIITLSFPTWEEQIEKQLIILPEVFEEKMRMSNLPEPCDENDVDVVVLEPVIETIDLGVDSDTEDVADSQRCDADSRPDNTKSRPASVASSFTADDEDSNTMTSIDLSTVKTEPRDDIDGLSNVKILQTTHITQGTIDITNTDIINEQPVPNVKVEVEDPREMFKRNLLLNVNQFIESTQEMFQENEQGESSAKVTNQKLTSETELTGSGVTDTEQEIFQVNESTVTEVLENLETETQNLDADDMIKEKAEHFLKDRTVTTKPKIQNLVPDDIIKEKAVQFLEHRLVAAMSQTKDINSRSTPIDTTSADIQDDDYVVDDIIKEKAEQYISKSVSVKHVTNTNLQEDSNSNDSVLDDIIQQKAEEYLRKPDTKPDLAVEGGNVVCNDFVVDDGIEFVDDGIEYVEDDDYSLDSEDESEQSRRTLETIENDGTTPKFDLKLLMYPTVYTMKLDNMTVLQANDFESVYDKGLIESIVTESKPVSNLAINVLQIKQENEIIKQLNLSDDKKVTDDLFKPNNENDSSEYKSDTDISEDLKVKSTSYLLQKPRSRSYNPIQLCKNPDFNTRLKRLNVGFFTSPRNLQLIKACKPMTIDVHKAFEPKLVNGTLYLKSNAGAPPPIIFQDNDQSERTAVVPSAMPVQSLINNTIDDMLLPNLNANTCARSDETAERNTVINLPDITQIRRINQRLQTAEVTPIRVQNTNDVCRPSSDTPLVNLSVGDKCLFDGAEHKTIVNLQEPFNNPLPKFNKIQDVISPPGPSNDDINSFSVKISSTVNSQDSVTSSASQSGVIDNGNSNINLPANSPIARHSLPVDTSIFNPPFRQSYVGPKKLGRPSTKTDKPDKPKQKPSPYSAKDDRKSVPWNQAKRINTTNNLDEFLITIDTLNKMINKINGNELYFDATKKNKKQYWVFDNDGNKQKSNGNNIMKPVVKEQKAAKQKQIKQKAPTKATNQNQAKGEQVLPKRRQRKIDCCWSKYSIEKLTIGKRLIKSHPCPLPTCNCCCRDLLEKVLVELEVKRQERIGSKCVSIDLSDDEDNALRNACASIETVVQQASIPTPIVRVFCGDNNINSGITTNMTIQSPIPPNISAINTEQDSSHVIEAAIMPHNPNGSSNSVVFSHSLNTSTSVAGRGLPLNIGNVSSKPTSIEQTQIEGGIVTTLIPEGTVPLTSNRCTSVVCQSPCTKMYIPVPNTMSLLNTSMVSTETQTTTNLPLPQVRRENVGGSPPPLIKRQTKPRQFALMPMDTFQRKLVIDGSKKCPITRKVVQEKNTKKERVLSLNMTKKPIESPICLGKNKILLTTVKFPRVQVPQVESCPNPAVIPTSPLPDGVHLLLMPNGELSYSIDPGFQLDSEQLAALPAIVAAIQEQINVSPVQPVNKVATITQDEVIKLSDDENTSPNEENGTVQSLSASNLDIIPVPVEGKQKTDTFTQEVTVDQSKLSESVPIVATITQDEVIKLSDDENTSPNEENDAVQPLSASNLDKTPVPVEGNQKNDTFTQEVTVDQSKLSESVPPVEYLQNTDVNSGSVIEPSNTENQSDKNNVVTTELNSKTIPDKMCADDETSIQTNTELTKDVDSTAKSTIANELEELNECNANVGSPNKESDVIVDDSVTAGSSRNLLSDLMEMSGISAEDTKHTPQESVFQELLALSSNPAQLSTSTLQNNAPLNASADLDTMNLPELTAVTSLAELKYACENNGHFFKLDLDSGVIVAINVCIKKNPKTKVKNFGTTSTIDLTDEVEDSENKTSRIQIHGRLQKIQKHKIESAKPVKLFKAVHRMFTTANRAPILNRKAFGPKYTFVNSESGGKIRIKQKRKQALDKIEAKIDLVDSDAPMEEEYLLESSNSEDEYTVTYNKQTSSKISNNSHANIVVDDNDNSSDDEPLAKKAKRMKRNDTNEEADGQMHGAEKTGGQSAMETEIIEDNLCEATDTSSDQSKTNNTENSELQSQITSKDMNNCDTMESNQTSLVSFIEDDESDSQDDDCILGV